MSEEQFGMSGIRPIRSMSSIAERLVELLPEGSVRGLVNRLEELRRKRRRDRFSIVIETDAEGSVETVEVPERYTRRNDSS